MSDSAKLKAYVYSSAKLKAYVYSADAWHKWLAHQIMMVEIRNKQDKSCD